jgi:hypothetical protein
LKKIYCSTSKINQVEEAALKEAKNKKIAVFFQLSFGVLPVGDKYIYNKISEVKFIPEFCSICSVRM